MGRTLQMLRGTARAHKGKCRVIGGQQKMISVVDHHIEDGIVVRAAPSSGLAGGFVDEHGDVAFGKAHRGGKAGKAGANYMDRHQTRAWRMRIHNNRVRGK
jgi:hypothetical protein